MRARSIGLLIGLIIGISGCTSKDAAPAEPKAAEPAPAPAPAPAAEPAEDPVATAKDIYTNRCTVCHGATGKGDGDGSAALDPKPRDFTLAECAGVGKAPTMPANPDLDAKPEVVAELVKLIRGLAN
jgi:mono/diheme cytochrome c family protein